MVRCRIQVPTSRLGSMPEPPPMLMTMHGSGRSSMRTLSPMMRAPPWRVLAPFVCFSSARRVSCSSRVRVTARRTPLRLPATGASCGEEAALVDGGRDLVDLLRRGLQDGMPYARLGEVLGAAALGVPVPAHDALAAAAEDATGAAWGGLQSAAGPTDVKAHAQAGAPGAEVDLAAPLAVHDLPAHRLAVPEDPSAVAL